jgi:fatty-acyl-CoA synthase
VSLVTQQDLARLHQHTVADLLRRTARREPGKVAIRCGEVTWTYRELHTLSTQVAAGFASLGVLVGDRVAVLAKNSHSVACIRYALAQCGAVLVPINWMLTAEEIAYLLRHSGAKTLCVDSQLASIGTAAAAIGTEVERFIWLPSEAPSNTPDDTLMRFSDLSGNAAPIEPFAPLDNRALLQIIYTSGTESTPKGVMLTHEAVISQYVSCLVEGEITHDDIVLHAMPLFHCAQLDVFLGPSIYVGGTNVITADTRPENLLQLLEQHRVSSFFAPPTVWISLLRSPLFDRCNLESLRKGYYGASSMPVAVLEEIRRRLPQTRLWNFYGQTEIAPLATVLRPEDQIRKAGSAGRSVLNVETRIVNEEGNDVVVGEIGEIVHRSPQLLNGYFKDEQRSMDALAGGWFHSGDLATVDDEGYITVVDRKKDVIKTGGENVASREVEEMIYGLEAVAEVAVVGLPDDVWVEIVTAVVVLKPGALLTDTSVIEHCRARMAHFKAPKRVVFATTLPKSPSGKVLKRQLRGALREAADPTSGTQL